MSTTSSRRRAIATAALSLSLALGLSVALSVSGPVPMAEAAVPPVAPAQAGFEQPALVQLGNIVVGNYAAVAAALEPNLQRQLNAEGIRRAWADFQRMHGNYLAHGGPVSVPRGELTVVEVPLNMTHQPGKFQITFQRDGRIAGLYLLNP